MRYDFGRGVLWAKAKQKDGKQDQMYTLLIPRNGNQERKNTLSGPEVILTNLLGKRPD